MVSGNIDMRAARDVYTFTGHADDVVKISGVGCDLGSMIVTLTDPKGHDVFAFGCAADSHFRLSEPGTYHVVINSWDWGPASYHFVFQGGPFH